jgi:hypothetical protein
MSLRTSLLLPAIFSVGAFFLTQCSRTGSPPQTSSLPGAVPHQRIFGGVLPNADPNSVALTSDQAAADEFCSAARVAGYDGIFLTAAHCAVVDKGSFVLSTGGSYSLVGRFFKYAVDGHVSHHDIAVLVTNQQVGTGSYYTITPWVAANVQMIGWGLYGLPGGLLTNGVEYQGTMNLTGISTDPNYPSMLSASFLVGGDQGTCYGDSGSPWLQNGKLVGIHSGANYNCPPPADHDGLEAVAVNMYDPDVEGFLSQGKSASVFLERATHVIAAVIKPAGDTSTISGERDDGTENIGEPGLGPCGTSGNIDSCYAVIVPGETETLVAHPGAGSKFLGWSSRTQIPCPCAGSTNPTCDIPAPPKPPIQSPQLACAGQFGPH